MTPHTASDRPPGRRESLWRAITDETAYESLDRNRTVDTVVVGGGIVGLTAAMLLTEAGQSVAVVERDRIVDGVTGRSTAKVTSQHGRIYQHIDSTYDTERARLYGEANEAAVQHVADRVSEWGVDCGFERRPAYTYTTDPSEAEKYRREAETAGGLGLPASFVEDVPGDADAVAGVRFDDQAQFDPRSYLLALATELTAAGGRIFEETRALDVEGGRRPRVVTDRGTLAADDIVLATHFPIVDHGLYFARLYPKRSYVVAVDADDPPEGLLYRDGTPYFSARTHVVDGERLTLVGGQNHKTGQGGDTNERYRKVEREAREHFDVSSVEYRWSTQDYVSIDKIPCVGAPNPISRHLHIATGFGGWGISNGVAAGMILRNRILDQPNRWASVFDPNRFAAAGMRALASENADVAETFVTDWATKPRTRDVDRLGPDEATITRRGGDVLGVYRDESGMDHAVSAVCPHMYCLVEWNDGERSWDCPCHGSRFDYDGTVIDGPAVEDLPRRHLDIERRELDAE